MPENRGEAIFLNSNIGILISRLDGSIDQANPYATQLLGYSEGELIGMKVESLVPVKLRTRHVEHRSDYNENPRPRAMGFGMDLSAVKKDGTEFPVEISLASFETGGSRYVVSFISDISERKAAEENLKKLNLELETKIGERTQELSQALLELKHINENLQKEMEYRKEVEREIRRTLEKEKELGELKSRFVSMASHEFRTPLSGILTSAALISRYRDSTEEPKRERHVQTIKNSVRHLTGILNDFLSLDKLEAGKVETRLTTFSLALEMQEWIDELQELSKLDPRIEFHHHGADAKVTLDRDLLRNVLINLVGNALKYSPDQCSVQVDSELVGDRIRISVRDEGIGIPQDEQKHLFERFFRARNALNVQGTGLGLNIVMRYLGILGGSIEFESKENQGSVFTVYLPLVEKS